MDYVNRPLVQKLIQFKQLNRISFHVPGHKNGLLSGLPEDFRSALSYDWTELEGLDDLHEPESVIKESQQKLTDLYHSDQSFFLVNGSTVGNLAMVYATCREGETIIVQRNAHKSIFNAIELTGAKPVFIHPSWDNKTQTAGAVTVEQVKKALACYPKAKSVILTYPTYYGVVGEELEKIIHYCHEQQVPVLVDEAHGAHFVIGEPFPRSALDMGADVVVHSAHKTLPAMTMASFLHVRSDFIVPERIAHYLKILQSSSPSYLLLASLDDARAYAESFRKEDIVSFLEKRKSFLTELNKILHLQVIETDDPLKLIIRIKGYSGFEVQEKMNGMGVYAELADPYQVLFVLPLLKKEDDYPFHKIAAMFNSIPVRSNEVDTLQPVSSQLLWNEISYPEYVVAELESFEVDWLQYEKAVGMIAAASIIPYPPGIPLLVVGERVTSTHIQSLKTLFTMGARFQGEIRIKEKQILVVTNETRE